MNGINYDIIEDVICKALSITGLDECHIRRGYIDVPTNMEVFASYKFGRTYQKARDSIFHRNKDGGVDIEERRIGFRYVEVEINFLGKGALNMASQVIHSLQTSEMIDYLYTSNVGYVDCSDVLDTTAIEMGKWEERGTFTITFYVPSIYDTEVKEIKTEDISFLVNSSSKKETIHIHNN